jgi:DNA helicase HerA-like ATPase
MRSSSDHIEIGDRFSWGGTRPIELDVPDRRHHMYMIGQTRVGKSTLLRNLILQDIHAGGGVGSSIRTVISLKNCSI